MVDPECAEKWEPSPGPHMSEKSVHKNFREKPYVILNRSLLLPIVEHLEFVLTVLRPFS